MGKGRDDFSGMGTRQRIGYRLVRLLGTLQAFTYRHVIGEYVWRSADGRCLPVSKMTDEHLQNAMKMLIKQQNQQRKLKMLSDEYTRRMNERRRQ